VEDGTNTALGREKPAGGEGSQKKESFAAKDNDEIAKALGWQEKEAVGGVSENWGEGGGEEGGCLTGCGGGGGGGGLPFFGGGRVGIYCAFRWGWGRRWRKWTKKIGGADSAAGGSAPGGASRRQTAFESEKKTCC